MNDTFSLPGGNEVKMSYGLLNAVTRIIGDLDNIHLVATDPQLANELLVALLSTRDKKGLITNEVSVFEIDMTPDQTIDLLQWAAEHVADFLLRGMSQAKTMVERKAPVLQSLMPTSSGGKA